MKIALMTSGLLVGAALVPVAAHAEDRDSDRMHPVTFVQDSYITTKVKTMLANEKMGSLAHVHVDTDANGAVYLSGTVRNQHDADEAVSIARGIDGVTSVVSQLTIRKDD